MFGISKKKDTPAELDGSSLSGVVHELLAYWLRSIGQWWDTLGNEAGSPGAVARSSPSWKPLFAGLSFALAFGGRCAQADDPKEALAQTAESSSATTTFEKRPFWWGSEAFRHNGWILDSDLSANGKRLATASWDSFAVWELPGGRKLLHVQESETVTAVGRDRISVVRLSPDGKRLANANKTTGAVQIWDIATGKRLATIPWDDETEKEAARKAGAETFERRKHSPDHYLAIEYLDDRRVRIASRYSSAIWDTTTNERTAVEFHPVSYHFSQTRDRKRVLRSRQFALELWDVEAGKTVRELKVGGDLYSTMAAVSDDQRFLAMARKSDTEIAVFDWKDNKEVAVLEFVPEKGYDRIGPMEFSPDGKFLYVGSFWGNVIVYDLATKAKVRSWKACPSSLMRMHFSPDGRTIHTGGGDGLARTWQLPDGKAIPVPEGYIGRLVFSWSRARNVMAVGDDQGRIDLWDATGVKINRTLQTNGEPIVQLAFSRSGRLLAASDGKGWTRLWSLETGDQIAKFGGTEESSAWLYNVLQISDDETKLLVRTGYSVKMYLIPEGRELWLAPPKQMATFALSPDGKTVCASSFNGPAISLYDAGTFQRPVPLEPTQDLQSPTYQVRFTFSPDSRVLAVASPKGSVVFFDGATGKHLGTQATENEALLQIGYTDDGTFAIAHNHSKAFLFDAIKFEKLGQVPLDVASLRRYRSATPGGMEKLLALFRPAGLPKSDLETCWKKLDSPRPGEVLEAMWQMSEAADLGPFLRRKIAPVAAPDGEAVRRLIQALDSPSFATREAASRKLGELGQPAEPFLRQALKGGQSAEVVARVERLLAVLVRPTPEEVRQRRVIFALETNCSADARRTLEDWANGASGSRLTERSKQALERMGR